MSTVLFILQKPVRNTQADQHSYTPSSSQREPHNLGESCVPYALARVWTKIFTVRAVAYDLYLSKSRLTGRAIVSLKAHLADAESIVARTGANTVLAAPVWTLR